jgi:hypothetical protein
MAVAQDAAPSDPVFAEAMVSVHNMVRARVGAPPLSWNQALADEAQAWAQTLASRGAFEHSRTDEGENLAAVSGAQPGGPGLAREWIDESMRYAYGPLVCDGRFEAIGHYTQMIWARTKAVACGLASRGRDQVLVCRYAPAGNICGQRPY